MNALGESQTDLELVEEQLELELELVRERKRERKVSWEWWISAVALGAAWAGSALCVGSRAVRCARF